MNNVLLFFVPKLPTDNAFVLFAAAVKKVFKRKQSRPPLNLLRILKICLRHSQNLGINDIFILKLNIAQQQMSGFALTFEC